jgi:repressor LexA
LLTVKGDSMIDAGLLPGDTVVVERAERADHGDIVVALVDDAYTVKRLVREQRRYVLKPENKAYPVLRPDTLEIAGIVVGSFRTY